MEYRYDYLKRNFPKMIDKENIDNSFQEEEALEYRSLLMDMESFDAWCKANKEEGREEFSQYFQSAIISAYYRYRRTKNKAWSSLRNAVMLICGAVLPGLSGIVLSWLFDKSGAAAEAHSLYLSVLIGVIWLVLFIFHGMNKKRAYDETWVRHSLCYSRLHLALNMFLTSLRKDEDYRLFVSNVFAIMEQNLDQFALNLCTRGIASRTKKSA